MTWIKISRQQHEPIWVHAIIPYIKKIAATAFVSLCLACPVHRTTNGSELQNAPSWWLRQFKTWWRHQKEPFSALLAICAGNSPVTGEFPAQRPLTRSFDVSLICVWIKWLSKQSWGWCIQTLSRPLWRHRNEKIYSHTITSEYRVARNWHSRLLSSLVKINFAPIFTCKNNRRIWCHNTSTPRPRDVTDNLW